MGVFDFFKKRRQNNEELKKWNKMWKLWAEGQADSPYAELMTYQGEINNGGHSQYFTNVKNTGNLQKEMMALQTVLPLKLKENLKKAHEAYLGLEAKEDDELLEEVLNQCDSLFYENEEKLNNILKVYSNTVKL